MSAFLPLCASSAGTGHSEERHEPPPARVHGDVFNEERPGCPDGDLQEAHHTEWRQVTHTHSIRFTGRACLHDLCKTPG